LRALAHAGRYAILEHLQTTGPATATECAGVAGLSPSACSYHLRLLARHGFVEEDTTRDRDGRERVWRATVSGWWSDVDPADDRAEVQALDSTLARVMMASSDEKVLAFVDRGTEEPEWRAAALMSNSTIVATARELEEISAAVMAAIRPYLVTNRPLDQAPEGARPVHVSVRMAPRAARRS
jgi:predicted ArsR family transcriptional regulator